MERRTQFLIGVPAVMLGVGVIVFRAYQQEQQPTVLDNGRVVVEALCNATNELFASPREPKWYQALHRNPNTGLAVFTKAEYPQTPMEVGERRSIEAEYEEIVGGVYRVRGGIYQRQPTESDEQLEYYFPIDAIQATVWCPSHSVRTAVKWITSLFRSISESHPYPAWDR